MLQIYFWLAKIIALCIGLFAVTWRYVQWKTTLRIIMPCKANIGSSCLLSGKEPKYTDHTHLPNNSFSSCSEQNAPRLATNSVEHGPLVAQGRPAVASVVAPTGLPSTGLGMWWWCGSPAAGATAAWCAIVSCGCNCCKRKVFKYKPLDFYIE